MSAFKFAEGTSVSVVKSQGEISETLDGLASPHSRLSMLLATGQATLSNPKVKTILVEEES